MPGPDTRDPFVRLSLIMIHRRWWVVGVFAVIVAGGMLFFGSRASDVVLPGGLNAVGSPSDRAATILSRDFGGNEDDMLLVVFDSPKLPVTSPPYRRQVEAAIRIISRQPHVRRVVSYYDSHDPTLVAKDRRVSVVQVLLTGTEAQVQPAAANLPDRLTGIALPHFTSGRPAIYGDTTRVSVEDLHRSEFVTVPIVLLLLLLVFRTVVAALIPLLLGISAIAITESAIDIIGAHTSVSIYALNIASIIGLGLAIDFSLIVVTRYRRELAQHPDIIDAIGATMATAGRSITYSGLTVIASMMVTTIIMLPLSIMRSMSLALLLTAAVALISALTLLPAILALLGHHIEALHVIPARTGAANQSERWYRLSRTIMAHPWLWLLGALTVIGLLAWPVRDLAVAGPNIQSLPASASSVQGTNLLSRAFGQGYIAPIQITVSSPTGILHPTTLRALDRVTTTISADPRVVSVQSLTSVARQAGIAPADLTAAALTARPHLAAAVGKLLNLRGSGHETIISVVSRYSAYDARTESLVTYLRSRILPRPPGLNAAAEDVGGPTAEFLDFRDAVYGRFPYVILSVMVLVFIILAMFFQSVFLPIKAVVLNLLSILATYGALTAIFVQGVGTRLLGFQGAGTISVLTPVILFVVLFALSTDYEVFMLSRVKETYGRIHDNTEAVASGLQQTAGVITAAGLILMFTFGSFATAQLLTVKEIGVGLAIGVLLDSTVVRVVMVPATMRLLGDRNWWMPLWMKRLLPELREGAAFSPASSPAPVRVAVYLRPGEGSCGVDRITLPTARPFRIGRDTSNDLQLFDRRVDGHHARVDYRDGQFLLTNLADESGVLVNDRAVTPHRRVTIRPGDRIHIGGLAGHDFAVETG